MFSITLHLYLTYILYCYSRGGQANASCDVSSSNQRVTRSQSRGDSAQSAVEPSREEMKSCDNTQDDDSVMSNTDE